MKRSKLLKTFSCLLGATYLLALPAAQALVLCVGEDDHRAVEFAHGDSCADSHLAENKSSSNHELHEASETSHHCHDCDDVSIDKLLTSTKSQSNDYIPIPTDTTIVSKPAFLSISPRDSGNLFIPRLKPPLTYPSFLATIILLL